MRKGDPLNLLIFELGDRVDAEHILIRGRRLHHLARTLQARKGDRVRVGELGGLMGRGHVVALEQDHARLRVELDIPPPPALPVKLVLALPRPKMLRRIVQSVAALGVKELYLINSYRVEKSYWQSPWLEPDAIREQLLLGLEQCGDTALPAVFMHKRFKPFVEDLLPGISTGTRALVAHPGAETPCPVDCGDCPVTLAVGPEGGFIPYEIEKLHDCGFEGISLGRRILKVETAVPVLLSRLFAPVMDR